MNILVGIEFYKCSWFDLNLLSELWIIPNFFFALPFVDPIMAVL